jgi:RNA polymerase sigma-70 factor (ECF subfamily)
MERYAAGDDGAFAAVFDAVSPPVYRLAAGMLRDRALAEDIVQLTFLNMHRARGTFVEGGNVLTWAKFIARRLVIDAIRLRVRDGRWTAADIEEAQARPPSPDEGVVAAETAGSIRAALAGLPASQQAVVELRAQGLSLAEMAKALGTSVLAVKLRIHRALQGLRAHK